MTPALLQRFDAYASRLIGRTESKEEASAIALYIKVFRAGFLLLVSTQMVHFVVRDRYYQMPENGPLWAGGNVGAILSLVMVVGVLALSAGSLSPRFRPDGLTGLAFLWGFHIFWGFPHVANHSFLMFFVLSGLALFWKDTAEEQALALSGLRWLAIIVLFWSGVQKVLYGQFFEGEFLAQRISVDPRYSGAFSWVMPEEVARLRALVPPEGPFEFQNALGLLLSNATYVAEIALGSILLLGGRFLPSAWAGAALLVVAVEAGAREFYFGVAMLQIVVLFAPRGQHRLWAPVFAVLPILLLLASFGIIPSLGITLMTTATKKRVLAAGLTALIVWPAIHFVLASTVKIHPWRFAGWAMYSVYRLRAVSVDAWRCDGATPPSCLDPIRLNALPADQQQRLMRFSRERSAWGALRTLDDVALDLTPQLQGSPMLRIRLGDVYLDPHTHTIRQSLEDFDYQRANESAPLKRR